MIFVVLVSKVFSSFLYNEDLLLYTVLLILTSQPIDMLTALGDGRQSREVHGSPPTYIEWAILVYVIGKQT